MAAEVGIAYVIIRADTKRLAGDVGDGLKDIDTDKAGKELGGSLGESSAEGFDSSFGDGVDKSITDSFEDPKHQKTAEESGKKNAQSHRKGFDKENKKHNPFDGLLDSFQKVGKTIGVLAAPQIAGGLLTAVGGAVAGATELLGFLVTAAAGAAVAMGGIFAAAIPAAGVMFAALKVNTKQLEAFKKQLGPIGDQWKVVAEVVQENLLPGVLDLLRATTDLIPLFKAFGKEVGIVGGNFARMAGFILTSAKNVEPLNRILSDSSEFMRIMSEAGLVLFDALIPLFATMTPLAVQFAGSLRSIAGDFAAFVAAGTGEGGTLGDTFQLWYDRLAQVFRIVGDLGVILWNIFTVAADAADPLFDGIERTVQKWREWSESESGKNWLVSWFEAANPFLSEAFGLLKDIGNIVLGPLLDTDFTTETAVVDMIRDDWLPIFERLGDALSGTGIGDALLILAGAFTDLIESFAGSSTIAATIEAFASAMEILADILSSPAAQAITPTLATMIGTWKVMKLLGLVSLAENLIVFGQAMIFVGGGGEVGAAGLGLFGTALLTVAWPLLAIAAAVAAIYLVWRNWDTIIAGLQAAWDWFTKLETPMKIFVGVLAAMAAVVAGPILAIPALLLGIVAAIKNWDKIVEILDNVWDAIWNFVTRLPEILKNLPGIIGDFFTGIGESIGEFITGLPDMLSDLGTNLKDAIVEGLKNLPNLILDALGALGNIGLDLLGLIADGLSTALPALAEWFVELPVKIIGWLGEAASSLAGIGIDILQFIVEGLVSAVPTILTFFLKLPFEIMTLLRKGIANLITLGIELISGLLTGFIAAWPRILAWFLALPGNIIRGIGVAAMWLWNVGNDIINGLWQGIQTSWDKVISFFTELPGKIVEFIGESVTWLEGVGGDLIQGLINGALEVWESVKEFFGDLPQKIYDLIVEGSVLLTEIGSKIIDWIVEGVESIAQKLWDWITDLPQTLWDNFTTGISMIWDIGKDIIINILVGIAELESDIWDWITDLPQTLWDTFTENLSKLWDLGKDVVINILVGIAEAEFKLWDWIKGVPRQMWDAIQAGWRWFTGIGSDIVGWVIDGLKDLGSKLWEALKKAWNWAADKFSITIPMPPGVDDIKISAPKFGEMGFIVPGTPGGTPIIAGEKNRPEALIPMTHPARALSLMRESGLDRLVLNNTQNMPAGSSGDTTMLRIENATFQEPVNADMMAQKLFSAYRRLAS